MIKFSEFVSLGHPDKIADYISQYILDRYIEKGPLTRYAVEVQTKDYRVTPARSREHSRRGSDATRLSKAVGEIQTQHSDIRLNVPLGIVRGVSTRQNVGIICMNY